MRRSARTVAALAACGAALTLAYALSLQPQWEPVHSDQQQYAALARGLAERGEFTRAAGGDAFIPEPLRSPGYPLFVATLCRTVGCGHWQIALAQALLVALLVVLVHHAAERVLSRRAALAAAGLVAFFPPLAYHAALELSDGFATVLLAAAIAAFLRLRRTGGLTSAFLCGALFGWLALVRLTFGLAIVVAVAIAAAVDGRRVLERGRALPLAAALLAFAIAVAPFFAYSYASLGTLSSSSSGSGLWFGYFQQRDPTALDPIERDAVDEVRGAIAAYDAVTDRQTQVAAWMALDRTFREHALPLIAHDPLGWLARGLGARSLVLWAGDEPLRVEDAAALPLLPRVALVAAQLTLFALGLAGAIALARRREEAALLPLAIIAYVWLASFPFVTESRYSLPAKPLLIIGAVAAIAALRRGGSPRGAASAARPGARAARAG